MSVDCTDQNLFKANIRVSLSSPTDSIDMSLGKLFRSINYTL